MNDRQQKFVDEKVQALLKKWAKKVRDGSNVVPMRRSSQDGFTRSSASWMDRVANSGK